MDATDREAVALGEASKVVEKLCSDKPDAAVGRHRLCISRHTVYRKDKAATKKFGGTG